MEHKELPNLPKRLWYKLSLFPNQQPILAVTAGPSFSFVYDRSLTRFLYTSPEATYMLGWTQDSLAHRSVGSILRRCHAEDLKSVLRALRKAEAYLIENKNEYQEDTVKMCIDFRLRIAKGNYMRVLLQTALPFGPDSKQRYWIGTVSDISYLKREGGVSFRFQSSQKQVRLSDISTNEKSFGLFSSRERDILRLLAKGYNTQMIEDTLHISQHTVRTHRRNMHKKCSVKNTAQLINLAIREGYI